MRRLLMTLILLGGALAGSACSGSTPTPTPTPSPSDTPAPTATPTATLEPGSTPGPTPTPAPVPNSGDWQGVSDDPYQSGGQLTLTFTVSGKELADTTVVWADTDGYTRMWRASSIHLVDGAFDSSAFTGVIVSSGDVLHLAGSFSAPNEITGKYALTDSGTKYTGTWQANPKL
jgi:hypothetical protein